MSFRLRFAPSPTGNLHLGGARTALFNWLYARHVGGQFLLRIEDTDLERSTDASKQAILSAMAWLGMFPDEEPVIQSSRRDEHVRIANELLANGQAYRCYCSSEELEEMRATATAEGRQPKYDGRWRDRTDAPTDGRPYTVRFKMPIGGATTVDDIVLGPITVSHDELDDLIILRSDGSPTYNFVVVCDDAFMGVTHVVRGQDHVSNTFRQYHIYKALGQEPPRFGHLPLIDGLSKRKGSAGVGDYRARGFLKEAIINYVARLGWSHGDQELFSPEELVALFDLKDVNKASGKFDEDKFIWVNQQWMKRLPAETLAERVLPYLAERGVETTADAKLVRLAAALQERSHDLIQMADGALFAYRAPETFDEKAVAKFMKADALPAFDTLLAALGGLSDFEPASIEQAFNGVVEATGLGMGKIAQPVRIALTGSSVSPPIFDTIAAVGRDEALRRLNHARSLFAAG